MSYVDFANAICHKAQKAAAAMVVSRITANSLESLLPIANVFGGITNSDITATRVVCLCKQAVPGEMWEGNWLADLTVEVRAPEADIAEDDFHALAGQIFAFFFQEEETVSSRLSNSTIKFTCQKIFPRGCGWNIEPGADGNGAEWVSEHRFQLQCCGSVID